MDQKKKRGGDRMKGREREKERKKGREREQEGRISI